MYTKSYYIIPLYFGYYKILFTIECNIFLDLYLMGWYNYSIKYIVRNCYDKREYRSKFLKDFQKKVAKHPKYIIHVLQKRKKCDKIYLLKGKGEKKNVKPKFT